MAGSADGLMTILERKKRGLEEMLRVLEEEREYLLGFKVDALHAAGLRKQKVMADMEPINRECRAILDEAGREQGLASGCTLSELIDRLDDPVSQDLKSLQSRLVSLANRIDGALELNRGLVGSAVGLVGRSMAFFNKLFTSASVYGDRGAMVERPAQARIIRAEI